MRTARRFVSFAAAFALIAAPLAQASAEGQAKTHHKRPTKQADRCPNHRTAEGEIVDCHGWRLRNGDWDNSCFNLDYLPSQFACSSRSHR
jgi:Ni/Co efflux regulator RcnB